MWVDMVCRVRRTICLLYLPLIFHDIIAALVLTLDEPPLHGYVRLPSRLNLQDRPASSISSPFINLAKFIFT